MILWSWILNTGKPLSFYRTNESPGTIIIQTAERHLYVIQGNSRALRYGIGVGREGFQWQGLVNITRKAEWPDWTPPNHRDVSFGTPFRQSQMGRRSW